MPYCAYLQRTPPTGKKQQQQQPPQKNTINTYFGKRNSGGGRMAAGNESSPIVLSGARFGMAKQRLRKHTIDIHACIGGASTNYAHE